MKYDELDKIISNGLDRLNKKTLDERLKRNNQKVFINRQIIFISLLTVISAALLILSWLISMTAFYTMVVWSFPIIASIITWYIVALIQYVSSDIFSVILVIYVIGLLLGFDLYKSVLTDAIREGHEFYIPMINYLVDLGL